MAKPRTVTRRDELIEQGVELSVRHLKQFFKFGRGPHALKTKAVHDVSFDIMKGECFGLVGESGCGKTTTGRSLIRLYNITSGSVYFEGVRISAGSRWNEKEIKWTRIRGLKKIKELKRQCKEEISAIDNDKELIDRISEIETRLEDIKSEKLGRDNELKERLEQSANIIDEEERALKVEEIRHEYDVAVSALSKEKEELLTKLNECKKILKQTKDGRIAEIKAKFAKEIKDIRDHIAEVTKEQREQIAQIKYDNKHVDRKLMSKMQMIFQDPVDSLDPRMTVEDIIQEGLHIQGEYNKYKNSQKVKEALIKVGLLPEYASRYPHEFSGGQRQRIGIARALIMNPSFLICDEPISALDVSIRAQIINLLNDLKEEMGLTMLFIAHDLSVVKYFCDRIAVMYYGEIVELATSDELFKNPLHPYTNALLSAIPKPDPLSEKKRQRYVYIPSKEHDYSQEAPKLVEITPGHFVLANTEELEKYRKKLKK